MAEFSISDVARLTPRLLLMSAKSDAYQAERDAPLISGAKTLDAGTELATLLLPDSTLRK